MNNEWYTISNIDELDSPALVIYPDRVKKNIQAAIATVGDPQRLRPHVKTHKTKEVTQLVLDAGVTKFKCATIAEAEMLAQCEAPDVLLAYQLLGPKLKRFVQLTLQYPQTQFSCLVDNTAAAIAIAKAFTEAGTVIPVYIDLNIGQNRTGIVPGDKAIQLYNYCAQLTGLAVAGLHAYDGHIREKDLAARTTACDAAFAPVTAMQQSLQSMGYSDLTIIAGGSPTFPIHAKRATVECSPGSFVFWDHNDSTLYTDQPFKPAALVVTRVISLPADNLVCLDLGHKSVAAENEISKRVFFQNAAPLTPVGQSEEHLVLDAGPNHTFKPGDVLYGLPYHICPTVALYDRGYTVENGAITGEWKIIARDRKINV